ncbi:hypothetical protein ACFQ0X_06725 [Streptomyces rectiviolaceus]|uniref:Uncharacterized protein n=1 Tax=Streptomyces rectiviolaceus TaxID=332591 RepID=A0ABP6NCN1_9ACTN
MLLEFGGDASGVGLVHDQDVVGRLSSDRADDALAVGVHARRLGCTLQHGDAFSLEDGVEGVGVLAYPPLRAVTNVMTRNNKRYTG